MIRKTTIIIISLVYLSFGAESKILNTIGNFIPSLTEVGYLTGMVNVYIQVSQFVRATNEIINNVRQAKSQWDELSKQVSYMYESIQALRNVNPLDLESCQRAVTRCQILLTGDLSDAARLFTNLEAYTIDQPLDYLQNLSTDEMYRDFQERTGAQVDSFFLESQYKEALGQFAIEVNAQAKAQCIEIEAAQTALLNGREYATLSAEEKTQYNELEIRRAGYMKQMLDQTPLTKNRIDTLIDEARSLITVNLAEINGIERQIQAMEELQGTLVAQYYQLIDATPTYRNDSAVTVTNINTDDPQYGPTANQVPFPQAPKNIVSQPTNKKVVNQQDIISMQNQIKYTMLKQEMLLRDMVAMKTNTMAFVLAFEAIKQYRNENQAIVMCTRDYDRKDKIDEIKRTGQ